MKKPPKVPKTALLAHKSTPKAPKRAPYVYKNGPEVLESAPKDSESILTIPKIISQAPQNYSKVPQ